MSTEAHNFPDLVNIDDTIIESEIFKEHFVCNLNACKGACCVAGDAGAPLESKECGTLELIYEQVKPYMRDEGKRAVRMQGKYVRKGKNYETPLVEGKECAYVHFDKNGTAKCAIETAYLEGKISYRKPISCHLYPIRIDQDRGFDRLRYERWSICKAACKHGKKLSVRLFEFAKEPLQRKYGKAWYQTLVAISKRFDKT